MLFFVNVLYVQEDGVGEVKGSADFLIVLVEARTGCVEAGVYALLLGFFKELTKEGGLK